MKRSILILIGLGLCLGACSSSPKTAARHDATSNTYVTLVAGDTLGLATFGQFVEQEGQPDGYVFAGVDTGE